MAMERPNRNVHSAHHSIDNLMNDSRYERTAILLLALGFGLVGLDRWIIAPLFPAMMQDLQLDYADLGNIIGVLGFSW